MTSSADVQTAALLLQRLGVSIDDLRASAADRAPVPTFEEYVPRPRLGSCIWETGSTQ